MYAPLYSKDGKAADTAQLAGRHPCECQAVKHPLVNNCLSCGRIACAQKGSGPCVFCVSLEVTREEQLDYDSNSAEITQIIDDERDYFSVDSNNCLTPVHREEGRVWTCGCASFLSKVTSMFVQGKKNLLFKYLTQFNLLHRDMIHDEDCFMMDGSGVSVRDIWRTMEDMRQNTETCTCWRWWTGRGHVYLPPHAP